MKYNKVEIEENGNIFDAFYFTEGRFKDIIFSYSRVSILEEKELARLSFNYYIHTKKLPLIFNRAKFKKALGDLLVELIEEGLKNNEIVYKNGTNEGVVDFEDRVDDTSELDFE